MWFNDQRENSMYKDWPNFEEKTTSFLEFYMKKYNNCKKKIGFVGC